MARVHAIPIWGGTPAPTERTQTPNERTKLNAWTNELAGAIWPQEPSSRHLIAEYEISYAGNQVPHVRVSW